MESKQLMRHIENLKRWLEEHPDQDGVSVRIDLAQNVRWLALCSFGATKKELLLESIHILETVMGLISTQHDLFVKHHLRVLDNLIYQYREIAELYDSEGNQPAADNDAVGARTSWYCLCICLTRRICLREFILPRLKAVIWASDS